MEAELSLIQVQSTKVSTECEAQSWSQSDVCQSNYHCTWTRKS